MGAFFYFKISSTSISQPQLPVIQTTNSTLPQKHPNSPLNLFTSISTTQLSGKHPGYVLSMQFFRYLGLTLSPVNCRKAQEIWHFLRLTGQPVTSILPSRHALQHRFDTIWQKFLFYLYPEIFDCFNKFINLTILEIRKEKTTSLPFAK